MIINQNIPAILRAFLNLPKKKKKKKIYIKQKSTATTTTTEFLSKIPDRRKISNEQFNLFQAEISFDVS